MSSAIGDLADRRVQKLQPIRVASQVNSARSPVKLWVDTPAGVPYIPESLFEHRQTFPNTWLDKWILPNPFVAPLMEALRDHAVGLADFAFSNQAANLGEASLNVEIRQLRATIGLSLERENGQLLVEKSVRHSDAAFFRIQLRFDGAASLATIAAKLLEEEVSSLRLFGFIGADIPQSL